MATQPTPAIENLSVEALLKAGAAHANVKRESGFTPVIVVPTGYELKALTPDLGIPPLPDHIRQTVQIAELESFAAYVKRYGGSDTLIFAKVDTAGATFTAAFDYHHAAKDGTDGTPANRNAHQAIYPCPNSYEYKVWSEKSGKGLNQEDFAAFIDANIPDIKSPDSASLLELVLNFEAKSNVEFSSEMTPKSGARSLKYIEKIEGGAVGGQGQMRVPDELLISIPVFQGGKAFEIRAKFKYRVGTGGKLTISYELYRPHVVIAEAIKDVIADITASTGLVPIVGSVQH